MAQIDANKQGPLPLSPQVVAIEIVGDADKTILQVTLTKFVQPEIYVLENPNRIFVDLPDIDFSLPPDQQAIGRGLIETYRYGEISQGKARLVLDTVGPVHINKTEFLKTKDAKGALLVVEIKNAKTTHEESKRTENKISSQQSLLLTERSNLDRNKNITSKKPVIVIDPGHGGIDSGAVGVQNLLEKEIVLKVAQKLNNRLSSGGIYKIIMTRSGDDFISLDERINISRLSSSDLFISLHADSLDQTSIAQSIKGATIYTLSENASDAEARAMAEKENASDLLAGLTVSEQKEDAAVKNILFDLIKRETSNFSADFSHSLVKAMRPHISLSRIPEKSAKFKVLKQSQSPAVLLELGYISNPKEAKLMISEEWQNKVCEAIASSIEDYFKKRSPDKVAN
ncbi:MAG: N-acetylmuramoyl-L-alanine amidase [Hyphomicrobium sp.]